MAERERAIVLVSGGLDSAVVLALARARGLACHALSFDYGQRHRAEVRAAGRVATSLGAASHRVVRIDLRAIGGSALTADIAVPRARRAGAGGIGSRAKRARGASAIPVTYVPARNMVFLSLAAGLAEVVGAGSVWIGVNAVDYSGYPDCRPAFIRAMQRAIGAGTKAGVEGGGGGIRIETPLIRMSKAAIIRAGSAAGVDFGLTHSCYDPSPRGLACGRCESCAIRSRGFEEAGVADPTRYVSRRG